MKFKVGDRVSVRWAPTEHGVIADIKAGYISVDWREYPGQHYANRLVRNDWEEHQLVLESNGVEVMVGLL